MLVLGIVVAVVILYILVSSIFTVDQQTVKIVERFGRFLKVSQAGLRAKVPFIDKIAGIIDLRVQQLDVEVETKTKDNVFIKIMN